MKTRSKRLRMTFHHPFTLNGVERPFPLGNYEVVIDAELIADTIRPVYRQVFTLIYLQPHRPSSIRRVNVDLSDLLAAHDRDQGMKESLQCH
jgi:hypothetical protein